MISKQTATDIALAYREVEVAENLLENVAKALVDGKQSDIRDAFGRLKTGLQLGVPSGENSQRLFNVPYDLAVPVIEAHLAASRAKIKALSEKAKHEIGGDPLSDNAPDLLAQLKSIVDAMPVNGGMVRLDGDELAAARTVILKATGEMS